MYILIYYFLIRKEKDIIITGDDQGMIRVYKLPKNSQIKDREIYDREAEKFLISYYSINISSIFFFSLIFLFFYCYYYLYRSI